MDYLALSIKGELWAAYPKGLPFPKMFASFFPSRGSGLISRALYLLNKIGLDRLFLHTSKHLRAIEYLQSFNYDTGSVAFFWPSQSRSVGRFYAYKVSCDREPQIAEYWKIATNDEERKLLENEAWNNAVASKFGEGIFRIPKFLGKEECGTATVFRYEPLPPDTVDMKCTHETLVMVKKALERMRDAGYQHRDFTLHNCKISGNNLWILDWESMANLSSAVPRMMDEISFWLCKEYYIEHKSIKEIAKRFREHFLMSNDTEKDAYESIVALERNKFLLAKMVSPLILSCK